MAKKRRKQKPEDDQTKRQKALRKTIDAIFLNSGFSKIKSDGFTFSIGDRAQNEIDSIFWRENIIIFAEDTIDTGHDHLRSKYETMCQIRSHWSDFLKILAQKFQFDTSRYGDTRWKPFFLYFCDGDIDFSTVSPDAYKPMVFVKKTALSYFFAMSGLLKRSFIYELYRFLGLKVEDIGPLSSPKTTNPSIPIVYPSQVTGVNEGPSLVSFMLSADILIRNGYVLRKDNWEESAGLYQRLLIPKKLRQIRRFVCETQRTFFNNIIVSLPNGAELHDKSGKVVTSKELDKFQNCTLSLPDEFNSICIIDGQHRVYAYFEDDSADALEKVVKPLRERVYLLVTGIIFPEDWSPMQRRSFESSLFLEINENSKTVSKDITIHIQAQKEPFAKNSVARAVLVKMNEKGPFAGRFQISLLEVDKIKTSSIIQFALARLVAPTVANNGLYAEWVKRPEAEGSPDELTKTNDPKGERLGAYISFCGNSLNQFFSAIKRTYREQWESAGSKMVRVFTINAFLIAYYKVLPLIGVKSYDYFSQTLEKAKRIDFSNPGYAGSQYAKFAEKELTDILLEQSDDSKESNN